MLSFSFNVTSQGRCKEHVCRITFTVAFILTSKFMSVNGVHVFLLDTHYVLKVSYG